MSKRIVYIVGDLSYPNGMSRVLSQKVNYLAEHTDYELYVVLTENASLQHYFKLSSKVEYVNFDINFEVIQMMPLYRKVWNYYWKIRQYRRKLTDYLMAVHPDITVSILRREINFINDIPDGSKKIGEIHFNKLNYRLFEKSYLPSFVNHYITQKWKSKLDYQVSRLDYFVVLTKGDVKNWPGLSNLSVIPNPIIRFPSVLSNGSSKHVIAAGRYSWEKGYDLLISAWKMVNQKHPDWILDVYGAGNNIAYQNLADEEGLVSVVRCHQASSDIFSRYAESSVFVLSSRYEGFGLVIAEAMATGLPVVSFRCPSGPEDIITDHEDGLLVENGNIEALAEAICYMIEHPKERQRMAAKALVSSQRYHEDTIMQKWIQLFDSL